MNDHTFFPLFGCRIPIDKQSNDHTFFTLFGSRIPIDRESYGPSDATPTTGLDCAGAIVAVDATLTLANYSTTEVVLSPEPLRLYNPHGNCMHGVSSSSSSTNGSKPRRVRETRRVRREPLQPQHDLSPEFLNLIGPARPLFLYRKRLEVSDVDPRQNRLLVTDTDRLKEFLTEEEMAKSKVDVRAIDEEGRQFKMRVSKWAEKEKRSSVVFNGKWTKILMINKVAIHDFVDVWGFRRDREGSTDEFYLAVAFSRG